MNKTKTDWPFSEKEANDSTGFLIWQLTTLWQRAIAEQLKPHGLTQVQFVLLAGLLWLEDKEKHVTQVILARHSKLDVMMTSQVLRALESRDLLLRRSHPTDTRAKVVELTQAGRDVTIEALPVVEGVDDTFFGEKGARRRAFNRELLRLITKS